MRVILLTAAGIALFSARPAFAQQPAGAAPPPAPAPTAMAAAQSPSQSLGLIVFPAQNQTKEQQLGDEQACYLWANQQTGIDPARVKANPDSAARAAGAKMDSAATGAAVGGAARGAVGGAAIGAITGDAGTGAAVGAAVGAVGGRRAKKKAVAQAEQQGAAQAQAQAAQLIDTFKKAMVVCLQGKGYTVG
jgi:hypothetical protein